MVNALLDVELDGFSKMKVETQLNDARFQAAQPRSSAAFILGV
jgi:hypothetical protein